MDVVEERRIGDDQVDAAVRQSGGGGVAARQVDRPLRQRAVPGQCLLDPTGERRRAYPAFARSPRAVDLRGRQPVVDRPQQAAAE